MMLLDTNVLSELRKAGRCDPAVAAWQRDQDLDQQFVSVISLLELKLGIELEARKNAEFATRLMLWYEGRVKTAFHGRILAVDIQIAEACATLHAARTRPYRDSLLAATALMHGFTVVTRNTDDFADTGLPLINPWKPAARR
ncbi:MAG: type II toxin-antitoxin system VapC family toxin [Terrimicrobiaceae bacterium]